MKDARYDLIDKIRWINGHKTFVVLMFWRFNYNLKDFFGWFIAFGTLTQSEDDP
ncbi:hypothetical protein YC2023_107560 [Brassica napus]